MMTSPCPHHQGHPLRLGQCQTHGHQRVSNLAESVTMKMNPGYTFKGGITPTMRSLGFMELTSLFTPWGAVDHVKNTSPQSPRRKSMSQRSSRLLTQIRPGSVPMQLNQIMHVFMHCARCAWIWKWFVLMVSIYCVLWLRSIAIHSHHYPPYCYRQKEGKGDEGPEWTPQSCLPCCSLKQWHRLLITKSVVTVLLLLLYSPLTWKDCMDDELHAHVSGVAMCVLWWMPLWNVRYGAFKH